MNPGAGRTTCNRDPFGLANVERMNRRNFPRRMAASVLTAGAAQAQQTNRRYRVIHCQLHRTCRNKFTPSGSWPIVIRPAETPQPSAKVCSSSAVRWCKNQFPHSM